MFSKIIAKYHSLRTPYRQIILGLVGYVVLGTLAHQIIIGPRRKYQAIPGKVVIITGSSAGIGKETARALAHLGATVVFACRDQAKTELLIKEIRTQSNNPNLHFVQLDLADRMNIQLFILEIQQQFGRVDILINNAGVSDYDLTYIDGVETVFAINQLGWFHLTNLILPLMQKQGRIINVASEMHRLINKKLDLEKAVRGELPNRYAISKYAMVASTKELQKRIEQVGMECKAVSLCPGAVRTEINDKSFKQHPIMRFLVKSSFYILFPISQNEVEGARTTLYAALQPYEQLCGGGFYHRAMLSSYSKHIDRLNQGEEIWEHCQQLLMQDDMHI